jgi:uncharacterized membrane protein
VITSILGTTYACQVLLIFFSHRKKIQRLRSGSNPRTREPEASMLTTRPPKPSEYSYTPTSPLGFHGLLEGEIYPYLTAIIMLPSFHGARCAYAAYGFALCTFCHNLIYKRRRFQCFSSCAQIIYTQFRRVTLH